MLFYFLLESKAKINWSSMSPIAIPTNSKSHTNIDGSEEGELKNDSQCTVRVSMATKYWIPFIDSK